MSSMRINRPQWFGVDIPTPPTPPTHPLGVNVGGVAELKYEVCKYCRCNYTPNPKAPPGFCRRGCEARYNARVE